MNQQSTDRPENELPDNILRWPLESIEQETAPSGQTPVLNAGTFRTLAGFRQSLKGPLPLVPSTIIVKFAATAAGLLVSIGLAAVLIWTIESASPAFGGPADKDPAPPAAAGSSDEPVLQQLEIERDVLQNSLALMNEDIDRQLRDFDKLDTDTADLENQESQLEDLKAIIKRVGTQLSLWNLELEAQQRITVMDVASRPQGDDSLQRDLKMAVAGIAGFCVMFLLAALSPRRRWAPAAGLAMVTGGLSAIAVWAVVPIRFEAQALIHVSKVTPVVLQSVAIGPGDEGYDVYKKTQLQLLKSNFVLSRAARKSEMVKLETMKEHKNDPIGFLESNLVVDYPDDAELMRVSIKGTRREELPIIVNSIVDAYMDEIVHGDKVARLRQKDLLAQNYSANQEAFRQKRDKSKKLARELGASSSEGARMRKKIAEQRLEVAVASADARKQRLRDVDMQILLLKERKAKAANAAAPAGDRLIEDEPAKTP